MDRKTVSIILGIALIAAFFLAFFKVGGTGLEIVQAKFFGWERYLLLVPPVCGLVLIINAVSRGTSAAFGLLSWLPLLAIIYLIIVSPLISGAKIDMVFKAIPKMYGPGMWITLIASLVLAFYNPRR